MTHRHEEVISCCNNISSKACVSEGNSSHNRRDESIPPGGVVMSGFDCSNAAIPERNISKVLSLKSNLSPDISSQVWVDNTRKPCSSKRNLRINARVEVTRIGLKEPLVSCDALRPR